LIEQNRLDLPQLDTEAKCFDLIIQTAEMFEQAIVAPTAEIACFVQPRPVRRCTDRG